MPELPSFVQSKLECFVWLRRFFEASTFLEFFSKRPSCLDVSRVARPSTRAGLEKLSHQTEESVSLGHGQREGSGSVQGKN